MTRSDRGQLGVLNLKVAAVVAGLLVTSLVGAFALGAIGAPSVQGVDNRFGDVTNETTIVHTDLLVVNPNPIGIQLGDTEINYTVRMNDVPMATGGGLGLDVRSGNSTQPFTTSMDNEQIPAWWATHVNDGERTVVSINATARTSILGERQFDLTQEREIETDVIGQFNSDETRPVDAENPPPTASNPFLYVNRTAADWGRATDEETPIDMEFEVFNPQLEPYVVGELGYEITMNGIPVGEGASEDTYVIPGGGVETLETETAIRTQRLDDWWVSHLRNDQVTDVRIEFYAVVSSDGITRDVRVPLEELTYEETIETDVFGNENGTRTGENGDPGTPTETPTLDDDGTPTSGSSTPTSTGTDGDVVDTPTPTETDGGIGL